MESTTASPPCQKYSRVREYLMQNIACRPMPLVFEFRGTTENRSHGRSSQYNDAFRDAVIQTPVNCLGTWLRDHHGVALRRPLYYSPLARAYIHRSARYSRETFPDNHSCRPTDINGSVPLLTFRSYSSSNPHYYRHKPNYTTPPPPFELQSRPAALRCANTEKRLE